MSSPKNKPDSKQPDAKGRVAVIHRAKYHKNIADEPEMKELKRMIRTGELDPDRAAEHLKQKKS
jgi:hypothetical protein